MINIIVDSKTRKIKKMPKDVKSLLREFGISPQEALVKVDGEIRPIDTKLKKDSEIRITTVVFGG